MGQVGGPWRKTGSLSLIDDTFLVSFRIVQQKSTTVSILHDLPRPERPRRAVVSRLPDCYNDPRFWKQVTFGATLMKRIRFLMIGGFLGAGKTTAIARLARHYISLGKNVGLVTNDQAYDLVDTQSLRAQGFHVGEVPGACFCCKFNDLIETADALSERDQPDVIITEPVGSCTDLVATVIEPLRHLHGDQYEIGPLAVLLKPEHGRKILREDAGVGFSPKAAYIFLKQIEEADIVAINKIDKLSEEQRAELIDLVRQRFPRKTIVAVSGRDGHGFESLIELLDKPGTHHQVMMDVDYDVYAQGEAELGWLNCSAHLEGDSFWLDDVLLELLGRLRDELRNRDIEPAHLKIMGQSDGDSAVVNLVGSEADAELSLASQIETIEADLIVNARVAADPDQLEKIVIDTLGSLAVDLGLMHQVNNMQRFRPGRPEPTHRMQ